MSGNFWMRGMLDELENAWSVHGTWKRVSEVADDEGIIDAEMEAPITRAYHHDKDLVAILCVEGLEQEVYASS